MKSTRKSSPARMKRYVPLVRDFAAGVVLFHETVAQQLGLHGTDVKALRLLGVAPTTAGGLAEATGLTNAAVTSLVDRLEASGYVVRERDAEDRRRVTVRAVPTALEALDRLYDGQGAEMSEVLAKYDDAQFAVIMDYLAKATAILARQSRALRESR